MSNDITKIIAASKTGVAQLGLYSAGKLIGTGTGFLVSDQLVTNAHVVPTATYDSLTITFGGESTDSIDLSEGEVAAATKTRSETNQYDYVVVDLAGSVKSGRHQFEFEKCENLEPGEEVVFFGYPFGTRNLTAHVGHISSIFTLNGVHRFQVDGSVNPGNSGGPLLRVQNGQCIGIVTQAQTGLERDFDELVEATGRNVEALANRPGGFVRISGVDPIAATRTTMAILQRVAVNLKRSANVGIGYAFCSEHIRSQYDFDA